MKIKRKDRIATIKLWRTLRSDSQGLVLPGRADVSQMLADFVDHTKIGYGRDDLHPGVAGQHQVYRRLIGAGCEADLACKLTGLTSEEVQAEANLRERMIDDCLNPDDRYDRLAYETLCIEVPTLLACIDISFANALPRYKSVAP